MGKGQSWVIALVIIGLVIVGLLAFISFKLSSPSLTGYAVNMPEDKPTKSQQEQNTQNPVTNSQQEQTSQDPVLYTSTGAMSEYLGKEKMPGGSIVGNCVINPPFYCNAWSVKDNYVILELRNNGGDEYNIKTAELTNCGKTNINIKIEPGEIKSIVVNCNIPNVDVFRTDITLQYSK